MLNEIATLKKRLKVPPMTEAEIAALKAETVIPAEVDAATPEIVRITAPKLRTALINIVGIAPYVQHAFSAKQREHMEATQRAGQQGRSKRTRAPKDFELIYENAKHVSEEGWCGIPAPAFRNACIDACRLCGFKMTHAKCSIFIEADGFDRNDSTPLVSIIGEPHIHRAPVRNETGVADIRWRPMWREWSAVVRLTFDEDQFSANDVFNLMMRAGLQVGIGEGRPFSPNSNGIGWGRFEIKS
jgi:hypothetical protein